MTIGITFFHILIYVSVFGLNHSFLFGFCEFSVSVTFLTTTCPFENSKINGQSVLCLQYVIAEFLYQQSQRQLTKPKMKSLPNNYGLLKIYSKKCSELIGFVCTTSQEMKSKCIQNSLTSQEILVSCNLYNNIRHNPCKFRLGFAFSYGM